MTRPYRIDASGRLHYVAHRRRTDTAPNARSDIAALLIWAAVSVATWIALLARLVQS